MPNLADFRIRATTVLNIIASPFERLYHISRALYQASRNRTQLGCKTRDIVIPDPVEEEVNEEVREETQEDIDIRS